MTTQAFIIFVAGWFTLIAIFLVVWHRVITLRKQQDLRETERYYEK